MSKSRAGDGSDDAFLAPFTPCLSSHKTQLIDLIMQRVIDIEANSSAPPSTDYLNGYLVETTTKDGDITCWRSTKNAAPATRTRSQPSKTPLIDKILNIPVNTAPQSAYQRRPSPPVAYTLSRESNERARAILAKIHADLVRFVDRELDDDDDVFSRSPIDAAIRQIRRRVGESQQVKTKAGKNCDDDYDRDELIVSIERALGELKKLKSGSSSKKKSRQQRRVGWKDDVTGDSRSLLRNALKQLALDDIDDSDKSDDDSDDDDDDDWCSLPDSVEATLGAIEAKIRLDERKYLSNERRERPARRRSSSSSFAPPPLPDEAALEDGAEAVGRLQRLRNRFKRKDKGKKAADGEAKGSAKDRILRKMHLKRGDKTKKKAKKGAGEEFVRPEPKLKSLARGSARFVDATNEKLMNKEQRAKPLPKAQLKVPASKLGRATELTSSLINGINYKVKNVRG